MSLNMAINDDPRAPYKVFEGEEVKGTYTTRAEARRRQQQLESQAEESEPPHRFIIKDKSRLVTKPQRFGLEDVP
jgi:hypothetical protein